MKMFEIDLRRHRQLIYNKPPPPETVDEGYRTYVPTFDFYETMKQKNKAINDDVDTNKEDYTPADKKVQNNEKSELYSSWALDGDTDIDEQLRIELARRNGSSHEDNGEDDNSQKLNNSAYIEPNETVVSSKRPISNSPTSGNITGNKYEPAYRSYQLLGDSQLVRFAEHILHMKVKNWKRKIQYCVSGQMINGLQDKLLEGQFHLHDQVIVLIGTNDMLNNTSYETMERSYNSILDHLRSRCSKIVLLTIPPVAKLEDDQLHWQRLRNFNEFILKKADEKVSVVDLAPLFMQDNNKCNHSLYEKRFSGNGRIDMIHLNKDGLKLLQQTLDEMYFRHQ